MRHSVCIVAIAWFALVGRADNPASRPAMAPVVALRVHPADLGADHANAGILIRELFRQSLLMTARERFGARTRDAAIGEMLPQAQAADAIVLDLVVQPRVGEALNLDLQDAGGASIWKKSLEFDDLTSGDYAAIVALAHRTGKQEFVEALTAAGLPKASPSSRPVSGEAPPQLLQAWLQQASWENQFRAARALHRRVASSGGSPSADTIGELVRAYAHLAALSAHFWDGSSDAFAARSLLYAEWLTELDSCAARSLRYRGYARAWAGMHAAALSDFEQVETKRDDCDDKRGELWTELANRLCHYDYDKLRSYVLGRSAVRSLAGLAELEVYASELQRPAGYAAARRAISASRLNARALDALGRRSGISDRRMATLYAIQLANMQAWSLFTTISRARGAAGVSPPDFDEEDPQLFTELKEWTRDLHRTGSAETDPGEPSWSAAAHATLETAFLAALRRADLMKNMWAVDSSDFVDRATEVLADHRFVRLLERFHTRITFTPAAAETLLLELPLDELSMNADVLLQELKKAGGNAARVGEKAIDEGRRFADDTSRDLSMYIDNDTDRRRRYQAVRHLGHISPHNPVPPAWLLLLEDGPQQAAELEKQHSRSSYFMQMLAYIHQRDGRLDEEERVRRKLVELVPYVDSYVELAKVYERQGKTDRWRETLQAALGDEVMDTGLGTTTVCITLANHYSKRGEHDSAMKYARLAAESGSGAAYRCAAECAERANLMDEAERWVSENSKRYEQMGSEWFWWCVRHGRGDRAAAFATLRSWADPETGVRHVHTAERLTFAALGLRENEDALRYARSGYRKFQSPFLGVLWAVLAGEAGDAESVDEALDRTIREGPGYTYTDGKPMMQYVEFARWLKTTGAEPKLDVAPVDGIVADCPPRRATNILYLTGRILARKNDPRAVDFFRRAAETGPVDHDSYMLAAAEMKSRNLPFKAPESQPAEPDSPTASRTSR